MEKGCNDSLMSGDLQRCEKQRVETSEPRSGRHLNLGEVEYVKRW